MVCTKYFDEHCKQEINGLCLSPLACCFFLSCPCLFFYFTIHLDAFFCLICLPCSAGLCHLGKQVLVALRIRNTSYLLAVCSISTSAEHQTTLKTFRCPLPAAQIFFFLPPTSPLFCTHMRYTLCNCSCHDG